jgi:ATP-dependent DNA helicase RecQ
MKTEKQFSFLLFTKQKGKEFDNVFIMLDNFNPTTDEAKRLLYVAMTRAKRNLMIHLNGNYLDNLTAENLERVEDEKHYLPPSELAMHLSFKDVWLDYFITRQHLVSQLTSGDTLIINGDECYKLQRTICFEILKAVSQYN